MTENMSINIGCGSIVEVCYPGGQGGGVYERGRVRGIHRLGVFVEMEEHDVMHAALWSDVHPTPATGCEDLQAMVDGGAVAPPPTTKATGQPKVGDVVRFGCEIEADDFGPWARGGVGTVLAVHDRGCLLADNEDGSLEGVEWKYVEPVGKVEASDEAPIVSTKSEGENVYLTPVVGMIVECDIPDERHGDRVAVEAEVVGTSPFGIWAKFTDMSDQEFIRGVPLERVRALLTEQVTAYPVPNFDEPVAMVEPVLVATG